MNIQSLWINIALFILCQEIANGVFLLDVTTKVRDNENHFRYHRMSWAFYQLRQFIEYKAKLNKSMVVDVDPAYTSQKCQNVVILIKKIEITRSTCLDVKLVIINLMMIELVQ